MVIPLDQRPRSGPYSGLNARSAKRFLAQAFVDAGMPFAEEDALEIVLAATGLDRTGLMLRGTEFLPPDVFEIIKINMARRLSGEPVDHILGWREFYGRRFTVNKNVLSPRADTESLIRVALAELKTKPTSEILDLGTGSGAIAITLAAELPEANVLATDLSAAALDIAERNAHTLNVAAQLKFAQGAWWDAVPADRKFDAVISNPPYIDDQAMTELEPEVLGFDPDLALRGGADGLAAYRVIIGRARRFLKSGGWLGLEIGFDQAETVSTFAQTAGFMDIRVTNDLGGNPRVISAHNPD